MASTAFISYSHEDRPQAEKLRAALEDADIAVTIDLKDMGAGDEIAVFIEDSIRSTDATVSLVSRNSLRSQWVARETLRAFEAGRFASKKYLPCYLDTDFFDPEFVTNEVSRINEQLDKLNDQRKRRQDLKVSSADIDDDIKRLMDLRNGLPDIVHRLKDDLTVDLTHGAFDDGVARLIAAIRAVEDGAKDTPRPRDAGSSEAHADAHPDAPARAEAPSDPEGFFAGLTVERAIRIAFGALFGVGALMVASNVIYGNLTEERYRKSPQQLTLPQYLEDPSHPRSGPLFFLSAKPSVEVVLSGLQIAHVDEDSILLDDPSSGDDVLIPGDGMDALGLLPGQTVSLQAGLLQQTPLGWVPAAPELAEAFLEWFDAPELDALRRWKITTDEGVVAADYLDPAQLSFSDVAPEPDFIFSLPDLAALDDLPERLAAWETDRNALAIKEARLVGQGWWGRDRPYFIVEAGEGLWAAVLYEPRQTSEWYWALDRLEGDPVVARGVPGPADDPEGRAFDTLRASRSGRLVLILDGYAISSPDGETLINLAGR